MKVDYVRSPTRSYKLILNDIVSDISSKNRVAFASGSGTRDVAVTYTLQGNCHNHVVHKNDNYVFNGTYFENKWQHKSAKPFHQDIMKA